MSHVPRHHIIYFRLIAVWALCEAMLGGIIHGLKIPVSGLAVGSCSVICISLIAWYIPAKGSIIKATVIVAIFKMMLSPQAPPPAYIAVFFQGLLAELLFWNRRWYSLSCILLAVLALLESALQRILVLTIIYGNDFWNLLNRFINGLTKQKQTTNYSLLLGGSYVLLHLLAGFLVGTLASRLPARIRKWRLNKQYIIAWNESRGFALPVAGKKRRGFKKSLFIIWLLLSALYVQSYFRIGRPLLPADISLKILLRSLIIMLGWIFLGGPLLKQLLHRWLKKKQSRSKQEVQEILLLLPFTRQLIAESWKRSAAYRGWGRISHCFRMILVNALGVPAEDPGIFILKGPVHSGKTSRLLAWMKKRKNVQGILTPVINGKRFFRNARTGEQFPMEAADGETEILSVGKFIFSKENFKRAIRVIRDSAQEPGWLVIDEIGPLELRGEGFSEVLREVLKQRNGKIILVAREGLAEKLSSFFNMEAELIDSCDELPD